MRGSDFVDAPPAKKLLAAHMDPEQAEATAKLAALLEKKKSKSQKTGSKGSLVTGAQTTGSRARSGEKDTEQSGKLVKKMTYQPVPDTRKFFTAFEEQTLFAGIEGLPPSSLRIAKPHITAGLPFENHCSIYPAVEVKLRRWRCS